MSKIYFHSEHGDAQISGAERAYAMLLCQGLFFNAMGIDDYTKSEPYRALLPVGAYPLRESDDVRFFTILRTYLTSFFGDPILTLPTGQQVRPWNASLNTAVAMGSDPVRLLAKLHAQCEIHCYVEGTHRAWLASIIEQGVKDNVLRTQHGLTSDEYGWDKVVTLLRARDDGPVVTSYSVTDQFPNKYIAQEGGWQPSDEELRAFFEKQEDLYAKDTANYEREIYDPDDNSGVASDYWYSLPESTQWTHAMAGLRKKNETAHLEMHPDTLGLQGYGNGLSGFDIYAAIYSKEG